MICRFLSNTKAYKEEQGVDDSDHDPDFFFGIVKTQMAKAKRVFNVVAIAKYTRALAFMEKNKVQLSNTTFWSILNIVCFV